MFLQIFNLSIAGDKLLIRLIFFQSAPDRDNTGDQPAKQQDGGELRKNIETRLCQTGPTTGLTKGDGAAAQMVRWRQFLSPALRVRLPACQAVQAEKNGNLNTPVVLD